MTKTLWDYVGDSRQPDPNKVSALLKKDQTLALFNSHVITTLDPRNMAHKLQWTESVFTGDSQRFVEPPEWRGESLGDVFTRAVSNVRNTGKAELWNPLTGIYYVLFRSSEERLVAFGFYLNHIRRNDTYVPVHWDEAPTWRSFRFLVALVSVLCKTNPETKKEALLEARRGDKVHLVHEQLPKELKNLEGVQRGADRDSVEKWYNEYDLSRDGLPTHLWLRFEFSDYWLVVRNIGSPGVEIRESVVVEVTGAHEGELFAKFGLMLMGQPGSK